MNRELLKETMRKYKKVSKVKYAITNPNSLGDCMSCVNYALCEKYGEESKGVWVKHWTTGMNKGDAVEHLKMVYVAHDLTEEQAKAFIDVFSEKYNVFPKVYNPSKCFELIEKGTDVYEVSYYDTQLNTTFSSNYVDLEDAVRYAEHLHNRPDIISVKITRIA